MAETMSWRTLELGEKGLPRLLAKTRVNQDGYDIQLTDLSRIWGEKLGKREIVTRASDEGCSIDPSEDDQYDILLEKIESALRGDKGTTLSLHSQTDGHALRLDLSAPLPGSLPTFVWNFRLERLPDSAVGLELVTPLVSQAARLRDQMQLLIGELASKDHVIGKITDRLEASGNDLTAVFPGASGVKMSRKRPQRGQLAGHVKGLADFDEHTWRASLKQGGEALDLTSDLLNSVLERLPIAEAGVPADEWWRYLPDAAAKGSQPRSRNGTSQRSQNSVRQPSQREASAANGQPTLRPEQSAEDDEFQRQGTPPQLKKAHPPADEEDGETDVTADEATKPDEMEDEETDDDDLDAAPSKASSSQTKGRSQQQGEKPSASKASPAPTRKLGVLGGRKSKTPQPAPEPVPEPDPETEDEEMPEPEPEPKAKFKGKLGAFGGKKAAGPQPAQDSEPEPEPIQESPPKKKSKLGTFGGASKPPPASEEAPEVDRPEPKPRSKLGTFGGRSRGSADAALTDSPAPEPEVATSPVKKKLGTMGGKGGSKSENAKPVKAESEPERQSRAPEKKEEPEEQEREDSQERANKKRERLKRELEEKAKAPVKKKRKF